MRNLKKILALVLALVMSLSLMATASAADTTAASDASKYQTAIDVLQGVGVVKGDAGTNDVRPTASITRAEVAALLYRIATGDVTDAQASIHTGQGFTDVNTIDWYAGYVSYCYIAEIIKGNPNGTFEPNKEINGYATLAMILRAMGYGKNGEFVGDGWEIRTASTAKSIGILDGISDTQLSGPAARELVFEILFRAIFKDMVKFSALYPNNYEPLGETLAKKNLGLEEVEGVVTANEFADLYGTSPLADGKTRLGSYTIDTTTGFDDIGESKLAYIQNNTKVIKIADSGKNATAESTAEEKNLTRILGEAGIETNAGTERFVNFGQGTNWTSDWKIKYEITLGGGFTTADEDLSKMTAAEEASWNDEVLRTLRFYASKGYTFNLPDTWEGYVPEYQGNNGEYDSNGKETKAPTEFYWVLTYTQEFRINAKIGPAHQQNIKEIFNVADKQSTYGYITGEVYVGTTSMKDVSDDKSFDAFKADYIKEDDEATVTGNQRGNWLKVIDNNADGKADYILKVIYTVAQVSGVKDDKITLDVKDRRLVDLEKSSDLCPKDSAVNTLTNQTVTTKDDADYTEPAVGDVVYYAIIDGNAYTYLTDMEVATFEDVNRNTRVAKTVDGTEWTESQVCEHIVDEAYMSNITAIAGKVSYDVYFDRGGYVAAFAKTEASDFKLITDGWFNSTKNNGYEYAVKVYNDETTEQDIVDIAANGSLFISGAVQNRGDWAVRNNDWNALKYLGGTVINNGARNNIKTVSGTDYPAALNGAILSGTNPNSVNDKNVVKTTVAAVSGDTILPVENASVSGRYQRNMIDLKKNEVLGSDYAEGVAYVTTGNDTAYDDVGTMEYLDPNDKQVKVRNLDNVEIRALSNTVYYVVYPTNSDYKDVGATSVGVKKFVGYGSVPSTINDRIEDVYAVGTRHAVDNNLGNNQKIYYTANIVVIELNREYPGSRTSVFVIDDDVSMSNVNKRTVQIIDGDGTQKPVTVVNQPNSQPTDKIDRYGRPLSASTQDWGTATPKWYPGLYWLNDTSVKDEYTLTRMTGAEIVAEGYQLGYVQYVEDTNENNYVTVMHLENAVDEDGNKTGWAKAPEEIAKDPAKKGTPYKVNHEAVWSLGYGVTGVIPGDADWSWTGYRNYCRDAADASTGSAINVLSAMKDKLYTLPFGVEREDGQYDHDAVWTWYNYNRVLIKQSKNVMSYAVSFENLTGENVDFSREVWEVLAHEVLTADTKFEGKNTFEVNDSANLVATDEFVITDKDGKTVSNTDGKAPITGKDGNRYVVKAPDGYEFDTTATLSVADGALDLYSYSSDAKELTVIINGAGTKDSDDDVVLTVKMKADTNGFAVTVAKSDEPALAAGAITVSPNKFIAGTAFGGQTITLTRGTLAAEDDFTITGVKYGDETLTRTEDYVVSDGVITLRDNTEAGDKKITAPIEVQVAITTQTYQVKVGPEGATGLKTVDNSKTIAAILVTDAYAVTTGTSTKVADKVKQEGPVDGVYTFTVNKGYDLVVEGIVDGASEGYAYGDVKTPTLTATGAAFTLTVPEVTGVTAQKVTVANAEKYDSATGSDGSVPSIGGTDTLTAAAGKDTVAEALENVTSITAPNDTVTEVAGSVVEDITDETDAPAGVTVYKVTAEDMTIKYYAVAVTVNEFEDVESAFENNDNVNVDTVKDGDDGVTDELDTPALDDIDLNKSYVPASIKNAEDNSVLAVTSVTTVTVANNDAFDAENQLKFSMQTRPDEVPVAPKPLPEGINSITFEKAASAALAAEPEAVTWNVTVKKAANTDVSNAPIAIRVIMHATTKAVLDATAMVNPTADTTNNHQECYPGAAGLVLKQADGDGGAKVLYIKKSSLKTVKTDADLGEVGSDAMKKLISWQNGANFATIAVADDGTITVENSKMSHQVVYDFTLDEEHTIVGAVHKYNSVMADIFGNTELTAAKSAGICFVPFCTDEVPTAESTWHIAILNASTGANLWNNTGDETWSYEVVEDSLWPAE